MTKSYPTIYFELLFIGFTIVLGMGLSQSFLPIFADELDPSGIIASLVVSAWFISRVFMEIPSGIISDRIGRSKLIIMGIGLAACGALLCALSNSIYILILGRGIWGFGTALYFMNNTALILDLADPSARGRALGTFQSIEFIGSFIGAPIGAFIADALGNLDLSIRNYNMVFYIATGLTLGSFVMALASKKLRQIGTTKNSNSSVSVKEIFLTLENLSVAIICVNTFSRSLIMGGINQTILEVYLNEEVKLDIGRIGIVLGARTAGHIISTFAAGYLSDRIGRRPIIIGGMLIESVSYFIYVSISEFEHFILAAFVSGLGEGMVFACLLVLLSEIVPIHIRGGTIGLYRTFMDLGGFIGPILFTYIFNLGVTSPFFVAMAILILNAALVAIMRKEKVRDTE